MQKRVWPVTETAVCAVTFEELDTARERTDGSIAALKAAGFPADRIFKAPQKTTDVPGSFDAAGILLTQHPGVKHWLVLGMNDTAVLGAVRATEGRGFAAESIIGIGINGTDCIDELRKAKPTGFHGSMLVSAPSEGFNTSEMLYHWIKDGTTLVLNRWYFLTQTWDGTTLRGYLNGAPSGTPLTIATAPGAPSRNWLVAAYHTVAIEIATGDYSEAAYWDRALSAGEVAHFAALGFGR